MGQTVLYLDPWTGVSGDMLLAALLDTDRQEGRLEALLRESVAALGLAGAGIEVLHDLERGVACTRVRVHDEAHGPLRHLADMEAIITAASLSDTVKARATAAVRRLASVEASIHGCSVEQIHFHEVGAVDTLVDVVGVLVLAEALSLDRVVVGPIPVGGGTIEIAHGRMGVPAPATARLLEGLHILGGPEPRELTTPTGALMVGELGATSGDLPLMRPRSVGYGAGSMRLECGPNVLRAIVGTTEGPAVESPSQAGDRVDHVVELQTNVDDVSSEVIGHTCETLRRIGALDVWTVPAHMKKSRTGVVLTALVDEHMAGEAAAALFEGTGTLGVRWQRVARCVAERGMTGVTVSGESIRVKWGRWRGRLISVSPEYDDAAAAAGALEIPLREVMHRATAAASASLKQDGRMDADEPGAQEEVGDVQT